MGLFRPSIVPYGRRPPPPPSASSGFASATGTSSVSFAVSAVGAATKAAVGTAAVAFIAAAVVSRFPLSVVSGGRYLVDSSGAPFFMIGDACQSGAASPTNSDFQSYCTTRAAQGFNTININFLEHVYAPSAPQDRDGNFPFSTKVGGGSYTSSSQDPDWTSWVDAYWANLETKVAYAKSKGILVSLAFYMGGGAQSGGHHTEGWYGELAADTSAHAAALGTYLINGHGVFGGFGHLDNVIWTWGADLLFSTDTTTRDKLHAMAAAVRAAAPASHLFAGDWGIPGTGQGLSTSQPTFETFSDLQAVYAYTNNGDIITTARNGYSYNPSTNTPDDGRSLTALPTYMKETGYEGESNPTGDPASVRKFGWLAILNGCTTGYWYGHRDVFNFAHPTGGGYAGAGLFPPYSDWDTSINSTGANDMQRLAAFCSSRPMHRLVPSGTSAPFVGTVIVTGGNDSSAGGAVAASATAAGDLCLCYTPSTNFTVAMTVMRGQVTAKWWDPTNGSFTAIGQFANTGTHAFTTPGTNSAGDSDWLLVLESPAGTSSVTFSASAVGVALKTSSGSSSVAFAASAVGQAVTLGAGASSVTFSATAIGAATGAAVAASSVTFTAAAVSSGSSSSTGTSSLTTTAAGVGASTAASVGAAAATLAASAAGASAATAAGTSTATFSPGAVGAGTASAAAASSVTFGAAAAGVGIGAGAGTSSVVFAASATTAGGTVGSASVVFSAAGVGRATAAAAGTSAATFGASATGTSSAKAAGTASATFGASGVTTGTNTSATGASSVAFAGSAVGVALATGQGAANVALTGAAVGASSAAAAGAAGVIFSGVAFLFPPPVAVIDPSGSSLTSPSSDEPRFKTRTR